MTPEKRAALQNLQSELETILGKGETLEPDEWSHLPAINVRDPLYKAVLAVQTFYGKRLPGGSARQVLRAVQNGGGGRLKLVALGR